MNLWTDTICCLLRYPENSSFQRHTLSSKALSLIGSASALFWRAEEIDNLVLKKPVPLLEVHHMARIRNNDILLGRVR